MAITPATLQRRDASRGKPCGASSIPADHKCQSGNGLKTAGKIALGAGVGALALSANSYRQGSRTGHLTHGNKANPRRAGGLANAAVPAVLGAVAGGAATAGALKILKHRRANRTKREADQYAHKKAIEALDKAKKGMPEDEWFDLYETTYEKAKGDYERKTPRRDAAGRPCGQGHIAAGKVCHKQGSFPTRKVLAVGLGAAAVGVGAYAYSRRRSRVSPVSVSVAPGTGSLIQPGNPRRLRGTTPKALPGDRTTRRLRGTTPKGLLPPSPPKQSKTARMRANTGAAVRQAEQRIAQTARQETRRLAQIGITMAETGEATGMVAKTGWRELRLRAEAARRRWEPGYRTPKPSFPRLLRGSAAEPLRVSITPRTLDPMRLRRRSDAMPGKPQAG